MMRRTIDPMNPPPLTRRWLPLTAAALAALTLSACQEPASKPVGGIADGEILPGSVSDAMIPLDTVRSQPPLAPKSASSDSTADKSDQKADERAGPKDKAKPAAKAPAPAAAAEPETDPTAE